MPYPEIQPLVEAFLIIEQPRQRLLHWAQALAPLDDEHAPPLAMVTTYFDPTTDQALIGLRYDAAALGRDRLAFVIEVALLAEVGMIQPGALSEGDRRRFLGERLVRCTILVADMRSVVESVTELVRRIRENKQVAQPIASVTLRPSAPAARGLPTRGDTQDPVLLVAKGTRDGIERGKVPKGTRNDLRTHNDLVDPIEPTHAEQARAISPNVMSRAPRAQLVDEPDPTLAASPSSRAQSARVQPAAAQIEQGTEPYLPTGFSPTPPGIIYARYLRSGRWVPLRIGALSLKGAALMAGALPRLNDHVDIALSFGSQRALVRGSVGKLSSVEEVTSTGAATFSVAFHLDDAARRQLTELLTAARAANVTIKPPPPRMARRFPVEWAMSFGTNRGAVRADALDVSREGMFVRPRHPLALDSNLVFSSVLDDGAAPIAGRAKVVRQINEAEARTCGLSAGYGVNITDMGDDDRARWFAFLDRVEKRAEKRVLIGAAPARLAELSASLAAAGYAVTGGTDPGALVQLASAEARPVDAALLDAGWLATESWLESLFTARNIPCVTVQGDVRRARALVDKLLHVAAPGRG